jgi:chromosome segregation ATPase
MTSSRYLVARVAQAFGYIRRAQRMGDAASEMHLLREAEAQLGAAIWEKVEDIEALSVEYWNLRKLIKERNEVRKKLAACQEKLNLAHEERSDILNSSPEINQELLAKRVAMLTELENLARQRDQVVADAREIRRSYVGLKMKVEVLTNEGGDSPANQKEIEKVKARLVELREQFTKLKQERIRIGLLIEEGDAKVDEADEQLKEEKRQRRLHASEAFQAIGEGNKEISILRAESGLIDTQMRQLYAEIGRYVSRHTRQDPACAVAAASHQGMVDVMRALRRSIALNHRLAGNSD